MALFPSQAEKHLRTIDRMKRRAHRKAVESIEYVFPWEAIERKRPVTEAVRKISFAFERDLVTVSPLVLAQSLDALDANDPLREQMRLALESIVRKAQKLSEDECTKQIELCTAFREFKEEWNLLSKNIDDGNFDGSGPVVFYQIDECRKIVEMFALDYETMGFRFDSPLFDDAPLAKSEPKKERKSILEGIDWKKLLFAGVGAGLVYWFANKPTKVWPFSKEDEDDEKPLLGPPVPITAEEKMLAEHNEG